MIWCNLQAKKDKDNAEACQNVKEAAKAVKESAKEVRKTTQFVRDTVSSTAETVRLIDIFLLYTMAIR